MITSRAGSVRRSLDPRLLIGLALVVASVAGVVTLLAAADESVAVLAAGDSLAPGDRIDADDLVAVDVRLDAATKHYLAPEDVPADGLVVTRAVGEGELVPADAVGGTESLRLASLVLDVTGALAASVKAGAVVDVWASREGESGTFGPPVVIASGALIVRLVESDLIVTGGATTAVEVLVPKTRIARVLEAGANSDVLSIVPSSVPVR